MSQDLLLHNSSDVASESRLHAALTTGLQVDPQSGSILDYLQILNKSRTSLLIAALIGLCAGIGLTFCQSPVYRANTALEIQEGKDDAFASKILSPTADPAQPDASADIQTQIRILQSRSLIENALLKAKLVPAQVSKRKTNDTFLSRFLPLSGKSGLEDLVNKTSKNMKVVQSGQTRIVEVSYDSSNPEAAARFTNALTAEYIEQTLNARLELSRRTTDWLVWQLEQLRKKLQSSEDALQTYAREKGLMYTGEKQNVSEEKLHQLQAELAKAQSERVEKQSRFEVAKTSSPANVPEILSDATLRSLENNLTDLRKQEAELNVTFKPDYVKTKRIHAGIEALQAAINEKQAAIVERINNELQESKRREQLLAGAYALQSKMVADDSEKAIQYDMLKHEVDTDRQIYQTMLQRVREANVASAMKATNVRVIDAAKVPEHPYKPNLPVNSGAGMLCGVLLGAATVVIRSKTNNSIQAPGEASALLGVPELGVIPSFADSSESPILQSLFTKRIGNDQASSYATETSQMADSFRSLLASILFAGARQRRRVLVITSASSGEGKTTTATNLAVTLANVNRKVLLIDGDIRCPKLHNIFGLSNQTGLTNVLGQIALTDAPLETAVQETGIPNLHVLTSGPVINAGGDLLFSASMPALIAKYREQYGMVLIDTPPMLTIPDARILGRAADAAVLVARCGKTGRDGLVAACRRLLEDHTPVLGVVLNDWKPESADAPSYVDQAVHAPRHMAV